MSVNNLFGTSGIRGLIGREIDENFAEKIGLALGQYLGKGKALVARDPRPGAKELAQALIKGLIKAGLKVDDSGILSTPELTWYQVRQKYDLGVSVTGSHLPWNMIGIIPTMSDGAGIAGKVGRQITKIYGSL